MTEFLGGSDRLTGFACPSLMGSSQWHQAGFPTRPESSTDFAVPPSCSVSASFLSFEASQHHGNPRQTLDTLCIPVQAILDQVSAWWDREQLDQYVLTKRSTQRSIDAAANLMPIRSDLHTVFDAKAFAIVPKRDSVSDERKQGQGVQFRKTD